ncbi:MAG: Spy/CpxP family protein refolding chaperone [Roseiarcus sp.]
MRKFLLASVALAALASTGSLGALAAEGDAPAPTAAELQSGREERAAMLEAHLAGLKAGLNLTAEQQKNWPAFEAAIREAARAREEARRQMRERMSDAEPPSPIERMRLMSDRLNKISDELTKLADAGKPLYDSLTNEQKRIFGPLLREFVGRGVHRGPQTGGEGGGAPGRME